jgi:hypothetical protein
MSRTKAVCAGVSPTNDHDVLIFGVYGMLSEQPLLNHVRWLEVLHGQVNACELTAWNAEIPGSRGSNCQEHSIELSLEFGQGNRGAGISTRPSA